MAFGTPFTGPVNTRSMNLVCPGFLMIIILLVSSGMVCAKNKTDAELKDRYVINLYSSLQPFDAKDIQKIDVFKKYRLYVVKYITPDKTWHRLRLGFFRSGRSAEKTRKKILKYYPSAWVSIPSLNEQRTSSKKIIVPLGDIPKKLIKKPVVKSKQNKKKVGINSTKQDSRGNDKNLLALTRNAITAGEYSKAIQFTTMMLEQEGNKNNREAIEFLGLARERNGQLAHAKSEYEKYLQLYPGGEDAERVQQRLSGLITASVPIKRTPKSMVKKEKKKPLWRTLGGVSQYYYRDERTVDNENKTVDLSQIVSTLSVTSRKVTDKYEHRIEFYGDQAYDFLDKESDNRFTNLYYEVIHRLSRRHLRVGRQSHSSGGVLGRFDGINAGVEMTKDITFDATAGYLLDPEGLFNYKSNRKFLSANVDFDNIIERADFNLYLIRQYVDDVLDRYAVGSEIRYFEPSYNMFNLIDYDIFYKELNVFLLNNNWVFSDASTFFANIDFRKSPYLTTYNSIINQPVQTVEELSNLFVLDEIYQLTLDRTAEVKTLSVGGSQPLKNFLKGYGAYQLSADVTVTNTGSMPASGGVEKIEGTGNEYFLGAQLIGNGIFSRADVTILSLRRGVAQRYKDFTFSLNNRFPLSGRTWRINPIIQYNRRESSINSDVRDTTRLSLKVEYKPSRTMQLESRVGIENSHEKVLDQAISSETFFFYAGYRWDFKL